MNLHIHPTEKTMLYRTLTVFYFVLFCTLCAIDTSAQQTTSTLPQTTAKRKVLWLHGRGENVFGFWQRYAGDFQRNYSGMLIDTLKDPIPASIVPRHITQYGYDTGTDISISAQDVYNRAILGSSVPDGAAVDNPIIIGHSQGGIVARQIDFAHPSNVGGIISIGSPHQGVNLIPADMRGELDASVLRGLGDITAGPEADFLLAVPSLAFIGGDFLSREVCDNGGDITPFLHGLTASLIGSIIQPIVTLVQALSYLNRLGVFLFSAGQFEASTALEAILWTLPSTAISSVKGIRQQLLYDNSGQLSPSAQNQNVGSDFLNRLNDPAINTTNVPRAGIYGNANFQSHFRLFTSQIGRTISGNRAEFFLCSKFYGTRVFPPFVGYIPQNQPFNAPDDGRLVNYVNRLRDVYNTNKWINYAFGVSSIFWAGPFALFIAPASFSVADKWTRGAHYWAHGSNNDWAHLVGSERTETYQTYKWVTPSCPEPWDPQCQNRQPVKVPYTVSYSISEGNDGFLNNTTEQMPLRMQTRFEDNFKADGANHFTEGNHFDVYRRLNDSFKDINSPFYVRQ